VCLGGVENRLYKKGVITNRRWMKYPGHCNVRYIDDDDDECEADIAVEQRVINCGDALE